EILGNKFSAGAYKVLGQNQWTECSSEELLSVQENVSMYIWKRGKLPHQFQSLRFHGFFLFVREHQI
ncbi:unnamed protein product, partial [Brassica rapa subsp. narinosa]